MPNFSHVMEEFILTSLHDTKPSQSILNKHFLKARKPSVSSTMSNSRRRRKLQVPLRPIELERGSDRVRQLD